MSDLIPFHFESHVLRVERDTDGEPIFHANDLCAILGYRNPRDAIRRHVEEDDVVKRDTIDSLGRTQMANWVREPGLWSLILGSETEQAKRVKRWVTAEVLPAIRKTGGYRQADVAKHDALIQRVELLEEILDLYRFKAQVLEERAQPKPKRRPSEPVTDEEVAQIRQMAAEGLGVCEIARQIGRSSATVSFILRGAKGGAS